MLFSCLTKKSTVATAIEIDSLHASHWGFFHYKALQLINFQIIYKIRSCQGYNIFSRKEETLF